MSVVSRMRDTLPTGRSVTSARRARSTILVVRLALAVAALGALPSCSGDPSAGTSIVPTAVLPFHVTFSAGALVTTLVVTVTGPGIGSPLVYNLPIVAGNANGSITVPVGAGRTITAQAFDSSGAVLFSGSTTITVSVGVNPPVNFALVPGVGTVPVTAVVGTVTVTVLPTVATVRAGLTTTVTPTVKDGLGAVVPGAVVVFATNAPPTAWAATGGVVTGLDAGTALISATSLGSSATAAITVTAGTALDFVTIAPATATAASGATITASVTVRDVSVPGVDSISISIMAAASLPITCKATAPFSGTRAAGVFRCNATLPVGAALGAWAPSQLKIYWGGPAGGGGGSTTFTPELLNARGVTAAVTVTP